jgi:catechol 2,3-dioxygenase-like lactoylglutathione lyase family enzyme
MRSVTGFNHVALVTADVDRLIEFYGDVLGGPGARDSQRSAARRVRLVDRERGLATRKPSCTTSSRPSTCFPLGSIGSKHLPRVTRC